MIETAEGCEDNRIGNSSAPAATVEVMAEAEQPLVDPPKKDRKKDRHHELTYKHHLTNVAHCCTLTYTVLIVYLCFKYPIEFFTWHPFLLSIGWMFLMTESVLLISKENVIVRRLRINHTWKERWHWIILTTGIVLIGIGLLIVTISKNRKNKEHYTSWHGLLGIIGIVAYIPPCLNGIPLLYRRDIGDYVNPRIVKFVHLISGVVSLTCGGLSLFLSVYTKWFARRTQSSNFIFYFSLIIVSFPVIWTIQRPLLKCINTVFNSGPGGKRKHKDRKP